MRRYKYGNEWLSFEQLVNMMDDEVRESVAADLAPCTNDEFLLEYAVRWHRRTGEMFLELPLEARGFDEVTREQVEEIVVETLYRDHRNLGQWTASVGVNLYPDSGLVMLWHATPDRLRCFQDWVSYDKFPRRYAIEELTRHLTNKINDWIGDVSLELLAGCKIQTIGYEED